MIMCMLHNLLYNIMNFYRFGRIRRSNKILSIHKFLFGLYRMNLQPHLQYSLLTTIINNFLVVWIEIISITYHFNVVGTFK